MGNVEAAATIVSTVMGVLVGIMPVAYLSWRERLLKDVEQQALEMRSRHLGQTMHTMGISTIHFEGCFRILNTTEDVDINKMPKRLARILESLPNGSGATQPTPIDYDGRAQLGLDEITMNCIKRAYKTFMATMVIMLTIAAASLLTLMSGEGWASSFPIRLGMQESGRQEDL